MEGKPGAPRRTHLAAERTWLAWWRTGLAATVGAIGIGKVLPEIVPGTTWPYTLLGTVYGVLGVALMAAAAIRQTRVRDALARDEFEELSNGWVMGFSLTGIVLAGFTVALVLAP